jgi:hypothetical protein
MATNLLHRLPATTNPKVCQMTDLENEEFRMISEIFYAEEM